MNFDLTALPLFLLNETARRLVIVEGGPFVERFDGYSVRWRKHEIRADNSFGSSGWEFPVSGPWRESSIVTKDRGCVGVWMVSVVAVAAGNDRVFKPIPRETALAIKAAYEAAAGGPRQLAAMP